MEDFALASVNAAVTVVNPQEEQKDEETNMGTLVKMKKKYHAPQPNPNDGVSPIRVRSKEYSRNEISAGTGISRAHITRVFNGKRRPSLQNVLSLAYYFEVSVEEVLSVVLPQNVRRHPLAA